MVMSIDPDFRKWLNINKPLPSHPSLLTSHCGQAVKLLPQPQPPVAFGLLKVKPEPCIEVT